MKSRSMKIITFLTVFLLTILLLGMVCATTTDNDMNTSCVDTIGDVTQTNHDKQATVNNVETSIKTENNDKLNEADTITKSINKNADNTAVKTVSANVTYSGEDTDTYEKVKNLIETSDDAQELIIELNKDKTYIITDPITFGTQTNTKTLTINGCNAIIDGNNTQSFITVLSGYTLNLNTITIQNTRADNGAAIYSSGTVTLNDAVFKDNSALYQGGAVFSTGTLTVNRTQFTDNRVTTTKNATEKYYGGGAIITIGTLSVDNSSFDGNVAEYDTIRHDLDVGYAGAIFIYDNMDNVRITNSQFNDNRAGFGGAVAVYDPQNRDEGNIILDSNNFNKNCAYQGVALFLQHSSIVTNNNFTENIPEKQTINVASSSGAILLFDDKSEKTYSLTLSDNIIDSNDGGKEGFGGAIVVDKDMILYSSNNLYKNNNAKYGGAIYTLGETTSVNDIFIENTAEYGGAILNLGNVTSVNDIFTDNIALYRGGAVYSVGKLTVNRTQFTDNRVTTTKNTLKEDYGGSAILARGILFVDNSSFTGNVAEYDAAGTLWDAGIGGAILVYNNTDDVSITNSQFTGNSAGYGGAVTVYDPLYRNEGNIVIDSNIFNKNHAYQGGALSLQHSTIVTNNNFTENMINQNVNAPFAGAAILIYDDQYEKTYTLTLSDNIFNANDAGNKGYGGAIYVDGSMILYSTGNIYENNKAEHGGAIANTGNTTSANDIFTENTAIYHGGAIHSEGTLNVNSSQFINNKVTTSKNATKEDYGGGAIFTTSSLTVDNSMFRGNVATHDNIESDEDGGPAGAIYIFNNTDVVIITNSNFTENNAAMGGAVNIFDPLYRNEGKILIDNNIFKENYAIQGGAISTLQPVNITNNKFIKNSVYYDENYLDSNGGAILLFNPETNEFTMNLINNTFSENNAEDNGDSGAICASENVILNSKNNVYENNRAVEGGVMLNTGSATFTNDIFTGNTATYGGVFSNSGNLTLNNCTFKDNGAEEYGDFVYTLNNMTISDSTINTDNLERLVVAYANVFAFNNTVNDEFLEEGLINSTVTLEKRDLVLNKENNIAGTLIDATDIPIVNAKVHLYVDGAYDSSAVTDKNGVFTFKYTPRNGTNATLRALFYPGNYYLTSYTQPVEVKIVNNDTNNTPQPKPPAPKVKPATTKNTKNAKKITQSNTYTIRLADDNTIVFTGNALTLEALNRIFDMNFTNGHLLVYLDGVLVFNDTTTDNLSMIILKILDKFLGEHEIKVVFTDNQNHTNTYKENIIIG